MCSNLLESQQKSLLRDAVIAGARGRMTNMKKTLKQLSFVILGLAPSASEELHKVVLGTTIC
jgi:hypothetical protein